MKKISSLVFLAAFLFISFNVSARAEEQQQEKKSCLKGIEVLTGYGIGKLRVGQGTFHAVPLFVDLDYDIKGFFEKIHLNTPGLMEFVLEPFASYIVDPRSDAEIGTNFLIKIGILPETSKIQPYFKGGVGMLYMTLHTVEQSTQFNFNEYAGLGVHYFFRKNMAFTLEYRFRHVSNAGIDSPNTGLNTNFAICGVSFRY